MTENLLYSVTTSEICPAWPPGYEAGRCFGRPTVRVERKQNRDYRQHPHNMFRLTGECESGGRLCPSEQILRSEKW